jgi:CubicO group peptidase (beta-lactamase class C family)
MPQGEIQNCALTDTRNKIPGGGLVSTGEDLVNFAIALNKGALLKRASVEQMFTLQNTEDGKPSPYGLGWRVQELAGRKWVGHEGSQPGVSTFLLMLPSDGFVVAILTNLEGLNLGPRALRVAQAVLR